jgi:threonylcarbamoyladenosine tRNA methylthiotransferase MtaB
VTFLETGLPSVAFETLGCKLNQCETETIAAAFTKCGFSIAADARDAWLLVINTCSVTSKAEQKGRRMIRAALKRNPSCPVIVTGCYAEVDRDGLEALDDGGMDGPRLFIVPGAQKSRILDMPAMLSAEGISDKAGLREALARICDGNGGGTAAADAFRFDAVSPALRSRAFLKIQDGCDNSCTYCLVRIARGAAQSLPEETVLERLRAAESSGAAEAVLTGVNIGRWSGAANRGLAELLSTLLSATNEIRIRLSSLEPDVLTEDFFSVLQNPRILPHFHISIQSGSAEVLKRMGRLYEPAAVLTLIHRLRELKDDPFIACDMIAGFPGETERHFSETCAFCRSADFAQVHVFPFSRRPGTAAWDYKPRVPEREAEKRVSILKNYAVLSRKRYIERWIGRNVGGVCMSSPAPVDASAGVVEVLTDNYLRVIARLSPRQKPRIPPRKGGRLECVITAGRDCAGGDAETLIDAYGEIPD